MESNAQPRRGFFAVVALNVDRFVEPCTIFLVLGFATRFSSLTLLVITIMIQYYVLPGALWTTPIWAAILLVLMTCGAGIISIDQIIRYYYARSTQMADRPQTTKIDDLPLPHESPKTEDIPSLEGGIGNFATWDTGWRLLALGCHDRSRDAAPSS